MKNSNLYSILDAGLLVVCLHGLGNDAALVGGEGAGDLVGDRGVRPLLPQLLDCILGVLSRSVPKNIFVSNKSIHRGKIYEETKKF